MSSITDCKVTGEPPATKAPFIEVTPKYKTVRDACFMLHIVGDIIADYNNLWFFKPEGRLTL